MPGILLDGRTANLQPRGLLEVMTGLKRRGTGADQRVPMTDLLGVGHPVKVGKRGIREVDAYEALS